MASLITFAFSARNSPSISGLETLVNQTRDAARNMPFNCSFDGRDAQTVFSGQKVLSEKWQHSIGQLLADGSYTYTTTVGDNDHQNTKLCVHVHDHSTVRQKLPQTLTWSLSDVLSYSFIVYFPTSETCSADFKHSEKYGKLEITCPQDINGACVPFMWFNEFDSLSAEQKIIVYEFRTRYFAKMNEVNEVNEVGSLDFTLHRFADGEDWKSCRGFPSASNAFSLVLY